VFNVDHATKMGVAGPNKKGPPPGRAFGWR